MNAESGHPKPMQAHPFPASPLPGITPGWFILEGEVVKPALTAAFSPCVSLRTGIRRYKKVRNLAQKTRLIVP
jgi:hypothetical protein